MSLDQRPAATVHLNALRPGRRGNVGQRGLSPWVWILALIKLALTMSVANRYGFHRDELYYLDCARHLALGYVDFPLVVPLLAAIPAHVFPGSLVALRLLPALAGTAVVLLAGLTARELGGGRFAQGMSAFLVLVAGIYLGGDSMFQTVAFDHVTWAVTLLFAVRLARSGDPRWWLAIGVALGIGMETKYTIAMLGMGLVAGALLTSRRNDFRTPWPWLAGGIVLLLLSPNLVWQVRHDWVSLTYISSHHGRIGQDTSRISYLLEQVLFVNAPAIPVVVAGWRWLYRRPDLRMLAWAPVVVEVGYLLAGGKSYYATPVFVLLFAAGGVWAEGYCAGGRTILRRTLVIVPPVLVALLLLPIALPVLPASTAKSTGMFSVRDDYANMVGWPEFVSQVARVYGQVPSARRARTVILVGNYGEAGAIDQFGGKYGLPHALSGHLTYFYWKPNRVTAEHVILVQVAPSELDGQCGSVRKAGTVSNALGIHNEEWGESIWLCSGHVNLDAVWQAQQHFD